MMQLPKIAINNAQFTLIIVLLLVILGLVSYFKMPRSEDPQFDLPITLIEVVYPGASSQDIETLVVNPLEQEISAIENILSIESQVKKGGARITIEFNYGVDADFSFNKIKQAVSTVKPNLPEGVQDLLVFKATPVDVAIMQLALWSEPHSYKNSEYFAKQLEKRLETIKGVKRASIWGYPQPIVGVDLKLDLLSHYDISVTEVTQILQERALNITPGFVDASNRRFNVSSSGSFQHLDDVANTVIKSSDNYVLKLKDIASVNFSELEPNYLAYYDNKAVVFLTVEQSIHSNIFTVTDNIINEINNFKKNIPSNIHLATLFTQADSVKNRVNGFFNNLIQGLIVVGIMSLLFLGVREAIVVIAAIPLSFLIAIGWLDFTGFGLQQMSIVGLIIALGLLVDNAIVVTESIQREKQSCKNISEAAMIGTSKVGWAITSGTVTTLLAFLPMLMLQSSTGDFLRSMPITVVLVLLASLLIALTLTPLLATLFFNKQPRKIKTLQYYANIFAEKTYSQALTRCMRRKSVVLLVAFIVLIAMLSLFTQVGVSLFPKAEKPMLMINVETPANSSLAYTNQVMQQVADHVASQSLVTKVALNVGSANPRIYYNEVPKRGVETFGQVLVLLSDYQENKITKLVERLRTDFNQWPQATIEVKEFTQGPVTDQAVTIRLMSNSLTTLEKIAADLTKVMRQTDGLVNINNPIGLTTTELALAIDYEKAGLANVSISALDHTLKTVLSGSVVGLFSDANGEDYPIVVRGNKPELSQLNDITVYNRTHQGVLLSDLIKPELKKDQADFFHYQKLRMAKVSADVSTGYSIRELTAKIVNFLENYDMPNGSYYILGGEEENRQKSFGGLSQILLITAIGIFATLVLQFKSVLQPIIIFSSIPFAIAGSAIGLYIFDLSFSMMAFIGLISLFGIVVNNAIILIDTTNQNLHSGQPKNSAIISACSTRFTPIILTTLTTIGGLLPLTLFGGSLWQPLGVVIISGLCVSAVASLLLVPILIDLFTQHKN
jgi:multidrug efflux pump subunit AcrB